MACFIIQFFISDNHMIILKEEKYEKIEKFI